MKTLFLINPGSGRKSDTEKTVRLIRNAYSDSGLLFDIQLIDFSRLDQILDQAISENTRNIFAVGGDGTVNAIGTRLIGKSVNFGVIPKGSGNGYARNLGYSINTRLAIEQSIAATSIKVDTGTFNGLPFLNVAGVGLEAEVAKHFSMGKRRGFMPYAKSSAGRLFAYRPEDYEIIIDGEKHIFQEIMGIAVANGTQWGYDAKISSEARLTDGKLDLIIVRKFPLIKVGMILRRLFNGQFQGSKYVELYRACKIDITRSEPGNAQIDGEPIEAGRHISVGILEKSLRVLLPSTLTEEKIEAL